MQKQEIIQQIEEKISTMEKSKYPELVYVGKKLTANDLIEQLKATLKYLKNTQ